MTEQEKKVLEGLQFIGYVLPVIILVAGAPLALNMIAPNNTYGVRTAKTYQSTETWYAVNSLGGWAMVASGVLSIAILIWMQTG